VSAPLISLEQVRRILPTCPRTTLEVRHPHLLRALEEVAITTPLRVAAFIAQAAHESAGYTRTVENLNYSAAGLLATWPTRFTQKTAQAYARRPERIANYVYANRHGNGDEASGDGWKYRGRGDIQITFRDNYRACGEALGVDLVAAPELLQLPEYAPRSAAWFWSTRDLNRLADRGLFKDITRRINGGLTGYADRLLYYTRALNVLQPAAQEAVP
jgi:putative chitinase